MTSGSASMQTSQKRPIGRPKGTGSQRIYDELKRRILSMQMPPGSIIDENALAIEFGVSRTPVRESLIRLSTDGLVSLFPNRGATVSSLDLDEIPALLEALELTLRITTRLAALRRNHEDLEQIQRHQAALHMAGEAGDYIAMSESNTAFHLGIAKAARNRYFLGLFQALIPQYHRLTVSIISSSMRNDRNYKDYFSEIDSEHQAIYEAVGTRDWKLADRLAFEHARMIGKRMDKFIWPEEVSPIKLYDPPVAKAVTRARGRVRGAKA